MIARAMPRSEARLLACAIMPNHLHLVVQQGERPLDALMQPLLRRIAALLQQVHGLDGPMFWRPYACEPCLDPRHARNAIVYTHLNPVRAKLCGDPDGYRWTSHWLYASATSPAEQRIPPHLAEIASVLDPSVGLRLFANGPARPVEGLRDDYCAFLSWRMEADGHEERDPASGLIERPSPPATLPGGVGWDESLSPLFHSPLRHRSPRPHGPARPSAPDLDTLARGTLAAEAPGVPMSYLRGRGRGHERSRLRRAVILRAHAAGYRNVEIARYLGISDSAVSHVVCGARRTP